MNSRTLTIVLVVTLFVVLLIALCATGIVGMLASLPFGEDRWAHYKLGGMFSTDSPSLSDDKATVVFTSPATGQGDIYLADVSTGAAQRLTSSDNLEASPRLVPGRSTIVFEREQPPYCHIWLLDLKTRQETQLTKGNVSDDLYEVSPTGQHLLVGRSQPTFGAGKTVTPCLLDLQSGRLTELSGYSHARFGEGGSRLYLTTTTEQLQIVRVGLDLRGRERIGDGWIVDVSHGGPLIYILQGGQSPDDRLFWLDPADASQSQRIGDGHSATAFANGKVLYFVGYQHQAMLWQTGSQAKAIQGPRGYKVFPNRSIDGTIAVFFNMPPNDPERDYDIWLFDSVAEKFTPVLPIMPPQEAPAN